MVERVRASRSLSDSAVPISESVELTGTMASAADLRALGQTTRIERSTVQQLRSRIAYLREKTKEASNAKAFDFEQRLAEIRDKELAARAEKKAQKKAERDKARLELAQDTTMNQDGDSMMSMMGFSGFGTSKK